MRSLTLLLLLATHQVFAAEKLGRGLVAIECERGVFLSWRLLATDPEIVRFRIFRREGDSSWKLITNETLTATNFTDTEVEHGKTYRYQVRAFVGNIEIGRSKEVTVTVTGNPKPHIAIPLQGKYRAQKVAIADLDGDGEFDFVIKQPDFNVDPYQAPGYWKPSPDTYKLEAYLSDGTFLWRYDLGWAIELGIWYSPYLAYDVDGDGKAEVLTKAGEGDPREPTGHVMKGPEWLLMLDGLTGKEKRRVPWIPREGYEDYNRASRNFLAIAYLDGRNPFVIVQRGTYGLIRVWALDGRLRTVWQFEATKGSPAFGQGAHCLHAADVDGDGKDELVIGSACIDDDGKLLWSMGLGHPDVCVVADIDPEREGLEIFYGIEPRRQRDGICLVDARTGKILWGWDKPTTHIHSQGMVADIDPNHIGMECFAGERDFPEQRWLLSARGEILLQGKIPTLAPRAVWWDDDPQKEVLIGNKLIHWATQKELLRVEGTLVGIADVIGDWREEILTCVDGELRIYTTTIPTTRRHRCLMQDRQYRLGVAAMSMGYFCPPQLSKFDLP
jgi:rhamnogalacturonan endolyase